MKFPVGTKVVITNSSTINLWNGVRGVVKDYDPKELVYPYTLTLIDGTPNGSYKPGEIAEAFREDELVAEAETRDSALEEAKALLERHGFAFRIYGREDVDTMLDLYAEDPNEPLDTRTFREEIVEHVMKGDDWADMSKKGYDDESTLWGVIEGTRHDHPEWFIG